MGTWWPGVNWGSSPPSYNINGYLVLTGEANAQLSLSRLVVGVEVVVEFWVPPRLSETSCGLLALPQEDLPAQGSGA